MLAKAYLITKYFLFSFKFVMNFNQVENVLNWSNLEFQTNPLK